VLDNVERAVSLNEDLSHVTYVKQAGVVTDGHVLVDDAGVLDRHLESAERHHAGAELFVDVVEGRGLEGRSLIGHRTGEIVTRQRGRRSTIIAQQVFWTPSKIPDGSSLINEGEMILPHQGRHAS
jgi:hypothetical protein